MSVPNPGNSGVPAFLVDEKDHRRRLAQAIQQIVQGKINATIDVTLTASASSTTINDARIDFYSWLAPMALTFNAATDVAGGMYFTGFVKGQCVVHHRPDIATDRTIRFLIIG